MKSAIRFLLICIFHFALCFTVFAQDDDEIVKVDSSIVVVNTTVTDANGKPAPGLKQNHFKLFVDGAEQEIISFGAEVTPFAAIVLLDSSGSMEQRISMARSAAIQFLDGLRADDMTAIYNFDYKVSLIQDFSNSRDLPPNTYELKARGMTVLNDAIYKAAQELSNREEKRRAIIVLSDGADTKSSRSADKALKAALAADAVIYTVDMSSVEAHGRERIQNQGALKNFSEKSGGRFIAAPGGAALRDAFKNIVAELGRQYTLAFQPPDAKTDGKWHTIELKLSKPELVARSRKGYHAPKK